jgi:hypothetical protein
MGIGDCWDGPLRWASICARESKFRKGSKRINIGMSPSRRVMLVDPARLAPAPEPDIPQSRGSGGVSAAALGAATGELRGFVIPVYRARH